MATYSDNFDRSDTGANAGWGANWQHYTGGSSSNTGWEILSNLGREDLTEFLGERVMDRLREDGGRVIPFGWESYRGKAQE